MSRVRLGLALLSLVAGCGPLAASSPGSSPVGEYVSPAVDPSPAQASSGVGATGNDNFAAMDEVPVAGGELRLVEPRRTQDSSGAIVTAIMLPLRHTDVQTKVSGMSAMYTVTQTFENPYDEPIDAVYVFPLGDEAAITSYAIVIGERTIAGEIKKKEDARATYEDARAQGHTAALLEQDKRNIFRQRILRRVVATSSTASWCEGLDTDSTGTPASTSAVKLTVEPAILASAYGIEVTPGRPRSPARCAPTGVLPTAPAGR